ncbi:hypothetical protein EVA_20661 [gut metagenome]|uniref:Uncharacterized protein n=1 Tax=gut metagenome TaxID=749906 RepID=J9F9W0_9ZZZZ
MVLRSVKKSDLADVSTQFFSLHSSSLLISFRKNRPLN